MESMTSESKDDLISNFCNITGVEPDRGQFYLESANWNIQLAIQSFFEHSAEDIAMDTNPTEDQRSAQQLREMFGNQPIVEKTSSDSESLATNVDMPSKMIAKQTKSESKPKTTSKFATIDSLKRQTDSDSSEEEGQAFYAGGSERSGQQVLGPKKKNTNELVSNMFAAAKAHGAEVVDTTESTSSKRPINTFSGTGFKLGSDSQDSTQIPSKGSEEKSSKRLVLKLWRNGFCVDNGPLRAYNDPQNQEFLASIHRGDIPRELIQSSGTEVHLDMEDHRNEDSIVPQRRVEVFSGEGHRLGNPTADVVTTSVQPNTCHKTSESEAKKNLKVDESLPTTNIQIRLSDGSRLVVKLNLTNTISDIRQFICTSRPIYSSQSFVLMTTFPNKELTDETLTIGAANLANASIVQRIK